MDQQPQFKPDLKNIPQPETETAGVDEGFETRPTSKKIDFHLKPEELEAYLNQYVVDQPEAVEVLATKICTHFNRMRYEIEAGIAKNSALGNIKANVLMIGPTGVGKTYIVKLIADRIGVPFVKGDATKFSETGYVGGDVEDLVRELVREADGNIGMAEYGIIYIDEIDKIAASPGGTWGPDVSRTGVQRNLLKLMEETEVDMKVPHDLASQMEAVIQTQKTGKVERKKVNTRNILFVVSGAFEGLSERIAKRLTQKGIGFLRNDAASQASDVDILRQVSTRDLIDYGFESEFIGRLPVTVVLNQLNEESLYTILKNPTCAVIQAKKREFKAYGIDLTFEDEALRSLAQRAAVEKTGARGLLSAVEKILIKFEKRLPTLGVPQLTVTQQLIEHAEDTLHQVAFDHILTSFAQSFLEKSGVELRYHPKAREQLYREFVESKGRTTDLLDERLKDYIYGVKLLGVQELDVTAAILNDPGGTLDKLIKAAYDKKGQAQ
ncbi:MAG: AAA family ATPase [bacterium]|nr:AAA family ATPase [bacterium]